jgi:GntR family hexuronate regulon transcriptional repressor
MSDRRLYKTVAKQILALIEVGEFAPGSRLPGERELAERFGVSRVVVREAEISLETLGHIEVKVGSGAYVLDKGAGVLGSALPSVGPLELTEARAVFEGESAALAAPIISDEDIEKLEASVRGMTGEDGLSPDDADKAFHLTIANASGNTAIIHTIENLWKMREDSQQHHGVYKRVCEHDSSHREHEHSAIVDALKGRDPVKARSAMRQHFTRLLDAMLAATEEEAVEAVRKQLSQSRERFSISSRIG